MDPLHSATPVSFLYVADRDRAMAFYCETLGFALHSSDPYGDFIDLGGAMLRMTVMPEHQVHAHPVLGWNVDDMDAAVDALVDRGIAFAIYEGMGQDERGIWTAPDGATRVAFFADPEGNVLSLAQI